MNTFREKVKELREEARLTHAELQAKIERGGGGGISQSMISRLENSDIWPNAATVIDLAKAFGVTPDCLLLDVDLPVGQQISRVSKIMQRVTDEGRAKITTYAANVLEGEVDTRNKALSTAENLLRIIEETGNAEYISRARQALYGKLYDTATASV